MMHQAMFDNLNKEQSKGHIIEAIDRNAAVAFFKDRKYYARRREPICTQRATV
jgi:hypothetical protein